MGKLVGTVYTDRAGYNENVQVIIRNSGGVDELVFHLVFTNKDTISKKQEIVSAATYKDGKFTLGLMSHNDEGSSDYYPGDFNNDGADDCIVVTNRILTACGNLAVPAGAIANVDNIKIMDFDGDGRPDILTLSNDGVGSIWEHNGTTFVNKLGGASNFFGKPENLFVGDFNGDGKTDYISFFSGKWHVFISTGVTFVEIYDNTLQGYEPASKVGKASAICVEDIDSDGKSEVCQAVDGNLYIYALTNDHFSNVVASINAEGGNAVVSLQSVDWDSDGQQELLYGREPQITGGIPVYVPYKKITFQQESRNKLYVSSVANGLGNTFAFTYKTYSNQLEFTPTFAKPTFPLMLVRGPWQLVSQLVVTSPGTTPVTSTYDYGNGYSHLGGLGFLGFSSFTATNVTTGDKTTSSLNYTIPGLDGIYSPWVREAKTYRGNTLLTTQTVDTMSAIGGNTTLKLFRAVVLSSSTSDNLKGVTASTKNDYDAAFGRLTNQTVKVGTWTVISEYTFDVSNRIVLVKTTKKNENGSHTAATEFTYYGNTRRLHTKTEKGIATSFDSFDSYGNPTGFSVAANTRTSSCKYDDKGRFVVESTDVLGNTSKAGYRSSDGAKLWQQDPLGNRTTFSYQLHGGDWVTVVTSPDGNTARSTLGWDQTGAGLYSVVKTLNGAEVHASYFNARGQQVKEAAAGYKGAVHTSSYAYNPDGSVNTATTSGIDTPTTYGYTSDGRVGTVTGFNTSVTYSYGGLSEGVTDNISGVDQTKTYDAVGNVTNVAGKMGEVTYTYWPSGAVKEITAEGGKTTMEYDDITGAQTSITEPNSGKTEYEYNTVNQLTAITDPVNKANNTPIKYEYDVKGRLIGKKGRETAEVYAYSTLPGRGGQLDNVTHTRSGKSVSEAYTYDGLGRVLTTKTVGDGKTLTTTNVYNGIGQLAQVTQSTGLILKYTYDNVGNITSIISIDNGTSTTVWDGVSKNELEQWTSFKLGNGLTTKYGYDAGTNLLQSIKTGITGNDTLVQNLGFTFNTAGQLTKRTEGLSRSESFIYDGLNRLKSATVAGKSSVTCSYAPNGNITETSLGATYSYANRSHIHAVSSDWHPGRVAIRFP